MTNARHLMSLLPPHTSFAWGERTDRKTQMAHMAVTIGVKEDSEGKKQISAFIKPYGSTEKVSFLIGQPATQTQPSDWVEVGYGDIIDKHQSEFVTTFDAPFRYLADDDNASRKKFRAVVKWYFITQGLVAQQDDHRLKGFYESIHQALELIEYGMAEECEESEEGERGEERETADMDLQDSAAQGTGANDQNGASQDQVDVGNQIAAASQQLVGQRHQPNPVAQEMAESTNKLLYLRQEVCDRGYKWVLEHRAIEAISWARNTYWNEYVDRQLFIGYRREDQKYAYAHLSANSAKVMFTVGRDSSDIGAPEKVRSDRLGGSKYKLNPPFNLIYSGENETLEKGEIVRLKTIMMWYFMLEGFLKEILDDETRRNNYTRDLFETLRYIGDKLRAPPSPSETPATNTDPAPSSLASRSSSAFPNTQTPNGIGSGTDRNLPVANPLERPLQPDLNGPPASSIQPPLSCTNSTPPTQTIGTVTRRAAAARSAPLSTSLRNSRTSLPNPQASSSVSNHSFSNRTAPRSTSGPLPTPESPPFGAQRDPSFTPTPAPSNHTAPRRASRPLPTPESPPSGAQRSSFMPTPAPPSRTEPGQTIDLTSNPDAQRSTTVLFDEDVYEQFNRALADKAQVVREHGVAVKEFKASEKRKWDHEEDVSKKRSRILSDHDTKYESKEKELREKKTAEKERMEAEIKRKMEEMQADMKRMMEEMDTDADEDLRRLKHERIEELNTVERQRQEWHNEWAPQHNNLQSRMQEIRDRTVMINNRVKESAQRL